MKFHQKQNTNDYSNRYSTDKEGIICFYSFSLVWSVKNLHIVTLSYSL